MLKLNNMGSQRQLSKLGICGKMGCLKRYLSTNANVKPFFTVKHRSSKSRARTGIIHTAHGDIETPNFVPVGTNGCMKSMTSQMAKDTNIQLMFCNTYHLLVHPGADTIEAAGGLHKFMNHNGPIITDSGGFQVFSLKYGSLGEFKKKTKSTSERKLVYKIKEEGVKFHSYRNGDIIYLSPETSIQAQKAFGSDIIIPFDELPPYDMEEKKLQYSLERTHRWEMRSLNEHLKDKRNQAIYSVIHGGINVELRKKSCEFLISESGFDGHAIGGSLGKNKQELKDTVKVMAPMLPLDKPVHLLGVGDIDCIDDTIGHGIDTYDSAFPTKIARTGALLTWNGLIRITSLKYKNDLSPIVEGCTCFACSKHTRAYIHHLFKASEATAFILASVHNTTFMTDYMAFLRKKIEMDEI